MSVVRIVPLFVASFVLSVSVAYADQACDDACSAAEEDCYAACESEPDLESCQIACDEEAGACYERCGN